MADIREPRVRFELRLQAIQAVYAAGYTSPESWQQIAYNQHSVEAALLVLYDAAIVEDGSDPSYQVWRDSQAAKVTESERFLAASGIDFRSSWVAAG